MNRVKFNEGTGTVKEKQVSLKQAVALSYRKNQDQAPRIVATGKGEVAERMIIEARKYEVPLYKDPELVSLLAKLPLGAEIPPELYRAVAEVFLFIYQLDQKARSSKKPMGR
ncbi:MAG: EscU/YscU/HrcU family type III secretion system export apparatus switch protein [Bacillota bacterium]|nr:EscU/YscU/HrcU family type III secretion system export apparatus switch protein [Bacillota bacterium]